MISRLLVGTVLSSLLLSPVFGVKYRDAGTPEIHLENGAQYDNVALVDTGSTLGSGTLIGDRWVLTAGHIIDGTAESTEVTFRNADGEDTVYGVTNQFIHSSFDGTEESFFDIGLYQLDRAVEGVEKATLYNPFETQSSNLPAVLDPGRPNTLVEFSEDEENLFKPLGQTFDFAGFGLHGPGYSESGSSDLQRRWGENVVEGWDGYEYDAFGDTFGLPSLWLSYFDDDFSGFDLPKESIAAPGDSGGGWFFEHEGSALLFAISTFSSLSGEIVPDGLPSSNAGVLDRAPVQDDYMAGVSLHNHLDWIYDTMDSGQPVPDSSSSILLLSGALLGLGFVRFRFQSKAS